MYIVDGIAYAGEPKPILSVVSIKPIENYRLIVEFNNGESRLFDFKSLLDSKVFSSLSDVALFNSVKLNHGVPVWKDGEIDISPYKLYEDGKIISNSEIA